MIGALFFHDVCYKFPLLGTKDEPVAMELEDQELECEDTISILAKGWSLDDTFYHIPNTDAAVLIMNIHLLSLLSWKVVVKGEQTT